MSASAMRPARTWIVSTIKNPIRTDEVDHLARSAEGGISYLTHEGLPPYLGVWSDPNGNGWHLYSDYPDSHHERFGWGRVETDQAQSDSTPRATKAISCQATTGADR